MGLISWTKGCNNQEVLSMVRKTDGSNQEETEKLIRIMRNEGLLKLAIYK